MRMLQRSMVAVGICTAVLLPGATWAQVPERVDLRADLFARQEVPPISEFGSGLLIGFLDQSPAPNDAHLEWELYYPGGLGVTQAHIHFGQPGVNGGIMVFLCSNLGNGPAGTPPCPEGAPAQEPVTGTALAEDVLGLSAQGLPAGGFFEFQRAVRQGVAYVNIHSTTFPGGVMRGQLRVVEEPQ